MIRWAPWEVPPSELSTRSLGLLACASAATIAVVAVRWARTAGPRRRVAHWLPEYEGYADDGIGGADDSRGSGLRGLADRVEALDGRLRVLSPAGAGTTVTAELPCGS
jgi:hypothetical protein